MSDGNEKFRFSIDRGGTFTDIYAEVPGGRAIVRKLLSVDPSNYRDAPTEGIRRILEEFTGILHPRDLPVDTARIEWIRMGTTVATNALLERQGARCALLVSRGFGDLLQIGNQSRPRIFDLEIRKPQLLYERVIEVDERVRLVSKQVGLPPDTSEADLLANAPHPVLRTLKGSTGESVWVLREPDLPLIRSQLESIYASGIRSVAVVFMHSYAFAEHERAVGQLARELGFEQVSLSSELMPMVKIVPRGFTACVDAYLTPCIHQYLRTFQAGFDAQLFQRVQVNFMQSDGGLAPVDSFYGFRAILSGPAGGVVGYAQTAFNPQTKQPVIGFDMGGTSTDVSRYAGSYEHVYETTIAGVSIMAPQLDVNTVAAGGGSMLFFRSGMFVVGPDSASAHPGPMCYKKGGPLTITDANVVLGRLLPEFFPKIFGPTQDQPLDVEACRKGFEKLTAEINAFFATHAKTDSEARQLSIEEVAMGFVRVANEAMCRPIRALTQARGYDLTTHSLAVFGGAGGQHACAIARALGMRSAFVHRYAGVLSAYGLGLAEVVQEEQAPMQTTLAAVGAMELIQSCLGSLGEEGRRKLREQGFAEEQIRVQNYLNLRYEGTDTAIMSSPEDEDRQVPAQPEDDLPGLAQFAPDSEAAAYARNFIRRYQREYGFTLARPLIVDDVRARAIGRGNEASVGHHLAPAAHFPNAPTPACVRPVFFAGGAAAVMSNSDSRQEDDENSSSSAILPNEEIHQQNAGVWLDTPVYLLSALGAGDVMNGPAIIIDSTSTLLVEPNCRARVSEKGDVEIELLPSESTSSSSTCSTSSSSSTSTSLASSSSLSCDPIQLGIFSHRFMSIAEQMGRTLQRTSVSTNIKERLDFSCALFGPHGDLVANAPHLPVHLGAMQEAVKFQIRHLGDNWLDGDVIVTNHPQAGGSHLPDITVITPVFADVDESSNSSSPSSASSTSTGVRRRPVFFVASRGHHADIGGIFPGSMPPFSKHLYQEGAAIISHKLVSQGRFDEAGITELLQAPGKVKVPAGETPCSGTRNLSDNLSDLKAQVAANQKGIQLMTELIVQYGLRTVQAYMLFIQQNAELAVREMLREIAAARGLPETGGVLSAVDHLDDGTPISLTITIDRRLGSAVFDFSGTGPQLYANLNAPKAVTYSAIIYCLRCLVQRDIPLNQGCLNPIQIHIPEYSVLAPSADAAVVGGNVLTSQRVTDVILKVFQACAASQGCMNNFTVGNEYFGYYETICGGAGAGPSWHGQSGVHTHMTNTRITDPEIVERRYPMLLREFNLRPGSGGEGLFRGGDGVVREFEFLAPLSVGILSERRVLQPYGLRGGSPGACGRNTVRRFADGRVLSLGAKSTYAAQPGDRVRIESPGGGGFGVPLPTPAASSSASSIESSLLMTSSSTVAAPTRAGDESAGSVNQYRLAQEQA